MLSLTVVLRTAFISLFLLIIGPGLVGWALSVLTGLRIEAPQSSALVLLLVSEALGLVLWVLIIRWQMFGARSEQARIVAQLQSMDKDVFTYHTVQDFQYLPSLVIAANTTVAKLEKKRKDVLGNMAMMKESLSADEHAGIASRNYYVEFMLSLGSQQADLPSGQHVLMMFRINGLSQVNQEEGRIKGNALMAAFIALLKKDSVRLPSPNVTLVRLYSADLGLVALGVSDAQVHAWLDGFNSTLQNFQAHGGSVYDPVAFIGVTYFTPNESPIEVLARADDALRAALNGYGWVQGEDQGKGQQHGARNNYRFHDALELAHYPVKARRALLERMGDAQYVALALEAVHGSDGALLYHRAVPVLTLPDGRQTQALELLQGSATAQQSAAIDLVCLDAAIAASHRVSEPIALRLHIDNLKRPYFLEKLEEHLDAKVTENTAPCNADLIFMLPALALNSLELDFATLALRLRPYGVSLGLFGLHEQIHLAAHFTRWGFTVAELDPGFSSQLSHSPQAQHYLQVMRQLINDPDFSLVGVGV